MRDQLHSAPAAMRAQRRLTIDRTDIPPPVVVFGVRFVLNLYGGARMRLRFTEGAEGVIGGGFGRGVHPRGQHVRDPVGAPDAGGTTSG